MKEIQDAFPDDVPDMKAATNHLSPLDHLPAQIGLFFPGRPGRFGVQVIEQYSKLPVH